MAIPARRRRNTRRFIQSTKLPRRRFCSRSMNGSGCLHRLCTTRGRSISPVEGEVVVTKSQYGALTSEPRNRRKADIVALGQFLERSTFGPAATGLRLLSVGEFRGTAHVLPASYRAAPAFRRAGADQVALHVGQPAENG